MPPFEPLPEAPRTNERGAAKLPPGLTGASGDDDPSSSQEDGALSTPADASPLPSGDHDSAEATPLPSDRDTADVSPLPSSERAIADDSPLPSDRDTAATSALPSSERGIADDSPLPSSTAPSSTPGDDAPASSPPPSDRAASADRDALVPDPSASEPTSAPAASSTPLHRRPLLASEALIEDLAPVEPLGRNAQIVCVVTGLLFALLGALPHLGVASRGRSAFVPSLVVGAVTVFAAVTRVSYRQRAVAMVAVGAIVAVLGIAGTGPAQGIAEGGAIWSIARWLAAALLPAALLFRARYRAFQGVRLLLGVAFLAALPFAVHALLLVMAPVDFGLVQVGALIALVALAAGLVGFMGSETTAAGTFIAPAMIAAFALQAGLQRIGAQIPGSLADVFGVIETAAEDPEAIQVAPAVALSIATVWDAAVTTVALGASALLSALGLFQILAWKFAPAARKIDLHRAQETAIPERPSTEEWSTRM